VRIPLGQYWRLLVGYLRPLRLRVVVLSVLLLTSIGAQLISPQIMRRFIDAATQMGATGAVLEARSAELRRTALWFIGFAVVQQLVSVAATYLSATVGWKATNALRADLAEHCLGLDMSFHNAHTPGEMIERLDGDVSALTNFFSQFTIQVFGSVLLLIGVLVLLYREDWRVGIAFTVFVIVAFVVMGRFRSIAVPHWEAARAASADLFGYLEERLAGTEDIRASGATAYVMLGFYRLMRTLYRRELKAGLMVNVMVNSTMLSFTLGNAVALALGALLYQRGVFTIGTAYIISYYSGMLMWPINRITRQLEDLQRAGAGIARIRELLTVRTRVHDRPDGQPIPDGALSVAFDRVSFAYRDSAAGDGNGAIEGDEAPERADEPESQTVLHDISFSLAPETVLGLLGRTGSGKTTLTRLLFRLYDPDTGSIRIGMRADHEEPVDIRETRLVDLRQHIGMVTQSIQLFHASVRDNLTFFDRGVSDRAIANVIDELRLGEWFHSLPEGLDTEIESGGSGLSAGEQQLLAFTRIFLQDPGLVILDEASSRLDPATEHLIERAVDRLVQGRTAIVIAHRLSTVQRADEVMILEKGRIQEYGRRSQLAADRTSRFYSLLQTGLEEVLA
jgi:ABC-type multidrug transport system fused ATPase/permease subunit